MSRIPIYDPSKYSRNSGNRQHAEKPRELAVVSSGREPCCTEPAGRADSAFKASLRSHRPLSKQERQLSTKQASLRRRVNAAAKQRAKWVHHRDEWEGVLAGLMLSDQKEVLSIPSVAWHHLKPATLTTAPWHTRQRLRVEQGGPLLVEYEPPPLETEKLSLTKAIPYEAWAEQDLKQRKKKAQEHRKLRQLEAEMSQKRKEQCDEAFENWLGKCDGRAPSQYCLWKAKLEEQDAAKQHDVKRMQRRAWKEPNPSTALNWQHPTERNYMNDKKDEAKKERIKRQRAAKWRYKLSTEEWLQQKKTQEKFDQAVSEMKKELEKTHRGDLHQRRLNDRRKDVGVTQCAYSYLATL